MHVNANLEKLMGSMNWKKEEKKEKNGCLDWLNLPNWLFFSYVAITLGETLALKRNQRNIAIAYIFSLFFPYVMMVDARSRNLFLQGDYSTSQMTISCIHTTKLKQTWHIFHIRFHGVKMTLLVMVNASFRW